MRKKGIILTTVVLGLAALLAGAFILSPFQTGTGIYIAADSTPFIVFDNGSGEPVIMLCGDRDDMFSKLNTGDRILIVHSGAMMLSYPAQMGVFFCIRLKKGDVSDVPEDAVRALKEMGWLRGGSIGENQ